MENTTQLNKRDVIQAMDQTFKNINAANFPTFPIQDKFGSLLVQYGASKIEAATVQIAAAIVANNAAYQGGKMLPETIAEEAYNIALACFEKTQEEFIKASAGVASAGAPLELVKP